MTALSDFLDEHPEVEAVGHRVVHGGSVFKGPVLLDARPDESLAALADLAPLHNPIGLAADQSNEGASTGAAPGRLLRHDVP